MHASATRPFYVVAVDGPAGAGKSSICSRVCDALGWTYVNTGAIYRAVGVLAHERHISATDTERLYEVAQDLAANFRWDAESRRLFYGNRDLTPALHSAEAGLLASAVAKVPAVRCALLAAQRCLAEGTTPGSLLDGRDIGTVVFPDADLKIFMTADIRQRAQRRRDQLLRMSGASPALEELVHDMEQRDRQDGERGVAPLIKAADAILFDTSSLGLEEAVQALVTLIRERCPVPHRPSH